MPYGTSIPPGSDTISISFEVPQERIERIISVYYKDSTLFKAEMKRRGRLPSLSSDEDKKKWKVKSLIIGEFLGGYRVDTVIFKDGSMWVRNEKLHTMKKEKDE